MPPASAPTGRYDLGSAGHWDLELVRYDIADDSPALAMGVSELPLPGQTSIAGVLRGHTLEAPQRIERLAPGDGVHVMTSAAHVDTLNRLFIAPHGPERLEEHRFFGDLVLDAAANIGDVAQFYGIEMPRGGEALSLGDYLERVFRKRPVVGDRVKAGRVEFVVRETAADGRVTRVGLKFR